MLAFNEAHRAGASGFETDLRLSKDGEIILSHDDNLSRFGFPEVNIAQLKSDELYRLEIPSVDGRYRDSLISLKTLLQAYPQKDYIFDCKVSDRLLFETLKDLLTDLEFHRRVWFLTWSLEGDAHVRNYFPGFSYFPRFLQSRIWGWTSIARLGNLLEPRNKILALPSFYMNLPVISKRQIKSIKKRKKSFMGYLVNTEREYRWCKSCGVEVVLTDRPGLIAKLEKVTKG
ncbi:hypothetical protein GWO43_07595 [candidate division KSB1 bacterium]|nr:hypothetical protein [candidate division KSB1 bacterium]NIR72523.1 hypothetical protein [candidate division KSB1 bacterium]NIS23822.1 hypothetical protein [candidate division KSB1 bacterium]NIT70749.1 hypothetical protein [candidate division KSB1 bacterium]NIU24264.1 hypothetical protein [candidate division KSB1 bacterium]